MNEFIEQGKSKYEDPEYLWDIFQHAQINCLESKIKAHNVVNYYHNIQLDAEILKTLQRRGQPAQTYNQIKKYSRILTGYFARMATNLRIMAKTDNPKDVINAEVMSKAVESVLQDNQFQLISGEVANEGILTGIFAFHIRAVKTDKVNELGENEMAVTLQAVPQREIFIDTHSRLPDYSDARYIHRVKEVSYKTVEKLWGKDKAEKLYVLGEAGSTEYFSLNETGIVDTYSHSAYEKRLSKFSIIHSILKIDDKMMSVYWTRNVVLEATEIEPLEDGTYMWEYRVMKLLSNDQAYNSSGGSYYYGVFEEVIGMQDAINQAVIKLQALINSAKVYINNTAIENVEAFEEAVNKTGAVIRVTDINGIKDVDQTREVQQQFASIEDYTKRIESTLNISKSFQGDAPASDSGVKTRFQSNVSSHALSYLLHKLELFYRYVGIDIANLIKNYYRSYQVLRYMDGDDQNKFVAINQPMLDEEGRIYTTSLLDEEGRPVLNDKDEAVLEIVTDEETDLQKLSFDVVVSTSPIATSDEEAANTIMAILQSSQGQMLAKIDPAGFMRASAKLSKLYKTSAGFDMAEIFNIAAQKLEQSPQEEDMAGQMATKLQTQTSSSPTQQAKGTKVMGERNRNG